MYLKLYFLSLAIFLTIDFIWLTIIAKDFYRNQIGHLMAEQFRLLPAFIFYLIYIAGLVLFALTPAMKENSSTVALIYGAVFGLVCYSTYDLTNLATLEGWPVKLVICDLIWGTFLSALTTFITFWIGSHWKIYFS